MDPTKKNGGTMVDDTDAHNVVMNQLKEGDLVLFVRLNKVTNEFQCIFPDLVTAIALHKLAGEHIDSQIRPMFQQHAPQIAIPNVGLPTFDRIRGRS